MKETGIIMSGDHPKLILEGKKTMTRRVIIPQPSKGAWNATVEHPSYGWFWKGLYQDWEGEADFFRRLVEHCPYGGVGDRLRVKETWALDLSFNNTPICDLPHNDFIFYKSMPDPYAHTIRGKWRSPLFIPRWASRILLEITEVRAERLQAITEEDAIAEGTIRYPAKIRQGNIYKALCDYTYEAYPLKWGFSKGERLRADYPSLGLARFYSLDKHDGQCIHLTPKEAFSMLEDESMSYREAFANLWDSLNAKRGFPWDGNWWVWPIGFKTLK